MVKTAMAGSAKMIAAQDVDLDLPQKVEASWFSWLSNRYSLQIGPEGVEDWYFNRETAYDMDQYTTKQK